MNVAEEVEAPPRMAVLLGRRLKSVRRDHGLSQEKLAQRADMSRETVRRLEGGVGVTADTLDRLLWAMGADAEELLATRAKRNARSRPSFGVIQGRPPSPAEPTQMPLMHPV